MSDIKILADVLSLCLSMSDIKILADVSSTPYLPMSDIQILADVSLTLTSPAAGGQTSTFSMVKGPFI